MVQLTLIGEVLKQAGLDTMEAKNTSFLEAMRRVAIGRSLLYGQVTSDDLRHAAARANLQPTHPNAWGAVFRGPGWVVVGRRPSDWPSAHRREVKVWKWEGTGSHDETD